MPVRDPVDGEHCPGCARRIRLHRGPAGCYWWHTDTGWTRSCGINTPFPDTTILPGSGSNLTRNDLRTDERQSTWPGAAPHHDDNDIGMRP